MNGPWTRRMLVAAALAAGLAVLPAIPACCCSGEPADAGAHAHGPASTHRHGSGHEADGGHSLGAAWHAWCPAPAPVPEPGFLETSRRVPQPNAVPGPPARTNTGSAALAPWPGACRRAGADDDPPGDRRSLRLTTCSLLI